MAGRIRSIKPEILDDEQVSALSDEAWRLWVSMWLLADDYGNLRAGDRYLASLVWQDSTRSPRVAEILRELSGHRIEVYQVHGERYAHITNWAKHQRVDNAGKPRVPGPDHVDSRAWDDSRGESPRVANSRESRRSDLRSPTTDHRPPTPTIPLPAAAGSPAESSSRSQLQLSPEAKPARRSEPKQPAGHNAILSVYCAEWVAARRPLDGKPPVISKADIKAASELARLGAVDEMARHIRRFVVDPDQWIAGRGYLLRDLPSRLNAYRQSPSSTHPATAQGWAAPTKPPTETHDATSKL